jgi:hypothetical protein
VGDYVLVFALASVALWWWTLADLILRKQHEWPGGDLSRAVWGIVIVVFGALGSIAYLLAGPPAKLGPRARA